MIGQGPKNALTVRIQTVEAKSWPARFVVIRKTSHPSVLHINDETKIWQFGAYFQKSRFVLVAAENVVLRSGLEFSFLQTNDAFSFETVG